ncbi:MAG: hypothetical protein ACC662_08255 [Planctomycetota bacterium]
MTEDDAAKRDDLDENEAPEAEAGAGGAFVEAGVAAQAEAEEAAAAAAEELFEAEGEMVETAEDAEGRVEEAMAQAHQDAFDARVAWSLVSGELLLILFANCLFFVGVLAAWNRQLPWDEGTVRAFNGLSTIRGAFIFALAIYGFWILLVNVRWRQLILWPFLLNAILALWVGIGGFVGTIGSARWDGANDHVQQLKETVGVSFLDQALIPLSSIAPGFWLLLLGGALVVILLVKGILGGASQAKAAKTAGRTSSSGSRRRRH